VVAPPDGSGERPRARPAWSVQIDEEQIVRRAADGDLDAFRLVYERNVDTVFGFLRNRVGAQRAEDLAAETFVRAFERIRGFEWRGIPIRAWLLRIAYNLIVGGSRRRAEDVALGSDVAPEVAGHEETIVERMSDSAVLRAVATLPVAQQSVLQLRFVQELSVAETAVVMDATDEAVRAMTYRALKALRRALDLEGT
jgi:RNA polymerase sigma-70 factor (ECF subfamily)